MESPGEEAALDTAIAEAEANEGVINRVGGGVSEQELASDSIIRSDIPSSSKQPPPKNENENENGKVERKDNNDKLKAKLVITGVVIAAIGALVAMIKKRKDA